MKITKEEFTKSLQENHPPQGLSLPQKALWYDAKNDWKNAHDLVDNLRDPVSFHIHAYLHRKEGDTWNADYWYSKANKKRPNLSLNEEWEQLVEAYI